MRIILLFFIAVLSFAFDVKITGVEGKTVTLERNVQKGISGIVLCPYLKEEIICARAVSFGKYAKLYAYSELKNPAFALPLVYPKVGDTVIFAKDYNRIMIIAPNQTDYLKVKNMYKNYTIISPDVFYAITDDKISEHKFVRFAKFMNIGRYIFVLKDGIYEVDAISFYVINKKQFKGAVYKKAFFTYARGFDIKPVNYKKWFKGLK
ncbi:plasminogen-binding N-terminal domain-containing protein [Caminibacter sp.]